MDNSKQGGEKPFDLSDLAGFQFGPQWARKSDDAKKGTNIGRRTSYDEPRPSAARRDNRDRGERRGGNFSRDNNRDNKRDNRRNDKGAPRGRERGAWQERPKRELPQPAEGLRVELRPSNLILEIFTKKIHEHKRALPLLELAKLVMSAPERYDLVFMKAENGPSMIHCTKADNACWLSEDEAMSHIWNAAWLSDFYSEVEVETEAPKGSFNAIAACSLGGELIGPVNWHGYQKALLDLHKSKYSRMSLENFRHKIEQKKDEESVAQWVAQASKKITWKPTREGAEDISLDDHRAVEADFKANHYNSCYETSDKVFINCAIDRKLLSPGLAAHMNILSDKSRRFPQMVIPNLCHGLARHHMPIYKWQGNHFTGPSRIRAIPTDMILADRMRAIIEWTKLNSGKTIDIMLNEISGVSAAEDEESIAAAQAAHAPYITDMIWLLEQGFLVVTQDNAIWYPKGEAAPPAPKLNKPKRSNKAAKPAKTPKAAPAPKKQDKAPKTEAPQATAETAAVDEVKPDSPEA